MVRDNLMLVLNMMRLEDEENAEIEMVFMLGLCTWYEERRVYSWPRGVECWKRELQVRRSGWVMDPLSSTTRSTFSKSLKKLQSTDSLEIKSNQDAMMMLSNFDQDKAIKVCIR